MDEQENKPMNEPVAEPVTTPTTEPVSEQKPVTTTSPPEKKKGHVSMTTLILSILLALVLAGVGGYYIGAKKTENDLNAKHQQQVSQLQTELSAAKANASGTVQEGKDAITSGQDTIASLQAENATLKATIDQQNKKIADLEKQLEEAQGSTGGTTN